MAPLGKEEESPLCTSNGRNKAEQKTATPPDPNFVVRSGSRTGFPLQRCERTEPLRVSGGHPMWQKFLNGMRRLREGRQPVTRAPHRRRPACERLEDRLVMSAYLLLPGIDGTNSPGEPHNAISL